MQLLSCIEKLTHNILVIEGNVSYLFIFCCLFIYSFVILWSNFFCNFMSFLILFYIHFFFVCFPKVFLQEVAWAAHLGVPAVLLPSPTENCINYSMVLTQALSLLHYSQVAMVSDNYSCPSSPPLKIISFEKNKWSLK